MIKAFGPKRSKGFRDKYLAPAMIGLAVILSLSASAQTYDTTKILLRNHAFGFDFNGIRARSFFQPPSDTLSMKQADSGAIATVNRVLYLWTGSFWSPITGQGGGSGAPVFQTTVQGLRILASPSESVFYYTQDEGKEGFWRIDAGDDSTADNTGTVVINGTTRFKRIIEGFISPRWFEAVPDGTTDSHVAVQAAVDVAIALHLRLEIDAPYSVGSTIINLSGSDFVIEGYGEGALISTSDRILQNSGHLSNVRIHGLKLYSTGTTGTVYGLFNSVDKDIDGLTISNCWFTAPEAITNGVKIVNSDSTRSKNIHIVGNLFDHLGSLGVEVQNHTYAGGDYRYSDIEVSGNTFRKLGQNSDYGMAVSFTGRGERLIVDGNHISGAKYIGIELAGSTRNVTVSNNVLDSLQSGCFPFSFSNALDSTTWSHDNVTVTGNVSTGKMRNNFYAIERGVVSGNTFKFDSTTGYVQLKDDHHLVFSNNQVYTKGQYSIFCTGEFSGNLISNNLLDNSGSTTNSAVVQMDGSGATNNIITGNSILRGTPGFYVAQTNNSQNNSFYGNYYDNDGDLLDYQEIVINDADTTLVLQHFQAKYLRFNGTLTAPRTVTLPAGKSGVLSVYNGTNESLTFTTGSGLTVEVPTLSPSHLGLDGTNVRELQDVTRRILDSAIAAAMDNVSGGSISVDYGLINDGSSITQPLKVDTAEASNGLVTHWRLRNYGDSIINLIEDAGGLSEVAHDTTLNGKGTSGDPLKVDTNVIAKIDKVYSIADSLASEIGATPPDGSETKIINGSGYSITGTGTDADPYMLTITGSSSSNPFKAISIEQYGGTADASVPASGNSATGTNNTPALQDAIDAAADGQWIIVPNGNWLFSTPLDTIRGPKRVNLLVLGNTYHNGSDFIIVKNESGPPEQHNFVFEGNDWGRVNMPSHSNTTHDNGTAPDWDDFTGTFFKFFNVYQVNVQFNQVGGFKNAFEFLGGSNGSGNNGCQENTIAGRWLRLNANGITMTSLNGNSYTDKNVVTGRNGGTLRITGGLALKIDGYSGLSEFNDPITGVKENYNGAFRSNEFHFMVEGVDSIMNVNGDVTENEFDVTVEGSGVFGDHGFQMRSVSPNYVRDPKYTGQGVYGIDWIQEGMGINATGSVPIWNSSLGRRYANDWTTDASGNIIFNNSKMSYFQRTNTDGDFLYAPGLEPHLIKTITTSTYTPVTYDRIIKYDHASGTLTMPTAGSNINRYITVKNIHATNDLTVANVDDHTTITAGQSITYTTDGQTWFAISNEEGSGGGGSGDSTFTADAAGRKTTYKLGFGTSSSSSTYGNFGASTTGVSSFRIASGSHPTSPANGDEWRVAKERYMAYNGITYTYLTVPDNGTAGQVVQRNAANTDNEYADPNNIYNNNGTIGAARTVTQNNNLRFSGTGELQKYGGLFRVADNAGPTTGSKAFRVVGNVIKGEEYNGSTWITKAVVLNGSSTGNASFNIAEGSAAPTSPEDGDVWRLGDDIYFRDGSTTYRLAIADTWETNTPSASGGPTGVTGTSPTITLSSDATNTSGKITITTGTAVSGLAPGKLFGITFGLTGTSMSGCDVVITPGNNATAQVFPFVVTSSTGFELDVVSALATSTTYVWYYTAKKK